MSAEHLYGKSVSILRFNTENKVVINKIELDNIFLHPEVKSRRVAIVSIVGAFRKGKSFFLDYCLRYMYANYKSIKNRSNDLRNKHDWMGSSQEPLKGFSWKSGKTRVTIGIIMWSDVFLHTNEKGEKLAIVLMDTQGLFDNESSPADNSMIFSLGTMLSSVQILNLFRLVQEDELQYLKFATEFAMIAAKDIIIDNSKPFQNFWFLIRDWCYPDEFNFGIEGGRKYLEDLLNIENKSNSELKSVRQFINASFDNVNCCLMPNPGPTVAEEKDYDGRWCKMDEDFKKELEIFISTILAPENLVLKKICNKYLNCSEMKAYIESYFKLYQSENIPKPQLVYDLMIDKQMNILIEKYVEYYKSCIRQKNITTENELLIFHRSVKNKIILLYQKEKKMANSEQEEKHRVELINQIEKVYMDWSVGIIRNIKILQKQQQKTKDALEEKKRNERERRENEILLLQKQKDIAAKIVLNKVEASKKEKLKKDQEKMKEGFGQNSKDSSYNNDSSDNSDSSNINDSSDSSNNNDRSDSSYISEIERNLSNRCTGYNKFNLYKRGCGLSGCKNCEVYQARVQLQLKTMKAADNDDISDNSDNNDRSDSSYISKIERNLSNRCTGYNKFNIYKRGCGLSGCKNCEEYQARVQLELKKMKAAD